MKAVRSISLTAEIYLPCWQAIRLVLCSDQAVVVEGKVEKVMFCGGGAYLCVHQNQIRELIFGVGDERHIYIDTSKH